MSTEKEIEKIEERDVGLVSDTAEQSEQKRESTRSRIALIYVVGFLFIIAVSLGIGFYKGLSVNDNTDLIVAISGVLSGPLGFIIGYYFKASRD